MKRIRPLSLPSCLRRACAHLFVLLFALGNLPYAEANSRHGGGSGSNVQKSNATRSGAYRSHSRSSSSSESARSANTRTRNIPRASTPSSNVRSRPNDRAAARPNPARSSNATRAIERTRPTLTPRATTATRPQVAPTPRVERVNRSTPPSPQQRPATPRVDHSQPRHTTERHDHSALRPSHRSHSSARITLRQGTPAPQVERHHSQPSTSRATGTSRSSIEAGYQSRIDAARERTRSPLTQTSPHAHSSRHSSVGGSAPRDGHLHQAEAARSDFYRQTRPESASLYFKDREATRERVAQHRDALRERSRDHHADERERFHHSRNIHAHRHHASCGHHRYNGRWHDYPSTHKHGPNCGHRQVNGFWVSYHTAHRHGPNCGHFYESGIWLSYTGSRHVHGAGCGHYFYSGSWHSYPRAHRHSSSCGHYHYDNAWHIAPRHHVHGPHCGHLFDGAKWVLFDGHDHQHKSGCGHHYYLNSWRAYPKHYYRINQPNRIFFFIDLGHYQQRNFPQPFYRKYFSNGYERNVLLSSDPISRAYAAFSEGDYYSSLLSFDTAVARDRENGLLYLARAQARIATGDYRAAYDDLIAGLQRIPEWLDVAFNISEIYARQADLNHHISELEDWVARYPRDYKAHFVLAYVYFFENDMLSAKNELIYTLSWDNEHRQAQAMMDRILASEAEAEVNWDREPTTESSP